jgi:hypothetical protein
MNARRLIDYLSGEVDIFMIEVVEFLCSGGGRDDL